MAVRGLEQEASALAETAVTRPDDVRNRRMGAWLESANAVMAKLAGVEAVEVREEEVDVKLDIKGYNGTACKPYTLTLVLGQGHDVGFSEMRLDPADVDVTDLEVAWLAESSSPCDLAHLLQEVRNRLACRMALEQELTGVCHHSQQPLVSASLLLRAFSLCVSLALLFSLPTSL